MNFETLNNRAKLIKIQRNVLLFLCLALLILALMLSSLLMMRKDKIVIIPGATREFSLEDGSISTIYIEEISEFFCHLLLDLIPHNIAARKNAMLRHVAPQSYQKIANYYDEMATRAQKYGSSTSFITKKVSINGSKVIVYGTYKIKMKDGCESIKSCSYSMILCQDTWRVVLQDFMKNDDK